MRGRNPTKQEKEWLNKAGEYGCVICKWFLEIESPCSIHHLEGRTKKRSAPINHWFMWQASPGEG